MIYTNRYESEVRTYCRKFPVTFNKAIGHKLYSIDDIIYIDFFSGAGSLNYGHNHPGMKQSLLEYIQENGVTNTLDLSSQAKEGFIKEFQEKILLPRSMSYKMQFCNPTGTNAVESACKLARKVTKLPKIVSFTNAFHGMTLGSLSLSGSKFIREGAGINLSNTYFMPYDKYYGKLINTLENIEKMFLGPSNGYDCPAAFVVETIQGEGGLNVASDEWLLGLQRLARQLNALLIVDDIQMGSGRTGQFFSFEHIPGFEPDIICLSKSLSGMGLPLSLVMMKDYLDIWKPGEHNGTFRGSNHSFITARVAINLWDDPKFVASVDALSIYFKELLESKFITNDGLSPSLKGRGMALGLEWNDASIARLVSQACFDRRLILETCGSDDQVLKIFPPLTISKETLREGISILEDAINAVYEKL